MVPEFACSTGNSCLIVRLGWPSPNFYRKKEREGVLEVGYKTSFGVHRRAGEEDLDTGSSDAKFLVLGIFNMFPKALDHGCHSVALHSDFPESPHMLKDGGVVSIIPVPCPLFSKAKRFCFSQYPYSVASCLTDMCALNHGFC